MDIEEIHQFIPMASLGEGSQVLHFSQVSNLPLGWRCLPSWRPPWTGCGRLTCSEMHTPLNTCNSRWEREEKTFSSVFISIILYLSIFIFDGWEEPTSKQCCPAENSLPWTRKRKPVEKKLWGWSVMEKLDLEEEDAKHVDDGGRHCNKVSLVLLVNVRLIHQIFNLLSVGQSVMTRCKNNI